MASLNYDGDIVNSSVQNMSNIAEKFVNLSSAMQNATNKIVSARGFNEYIGGISTDSFSGQVNECETASNTIINQIRQSQINILSYSEDKDEIKKFLSTLDRLDYKELDLTAIEDYISLRDKAKNVFSGLLGDVGAFFLGLGEGVVDFFETGADLIVTGGTSLAGIFTSLYDKAHGTNYTDKMWNWSRSFVGTKHSENLFNSIYANTATGRFIKNNAYGFDKVRGVGKGLGYTAGVVALTAVTGGAATGAFAGGVSAASLAGTVSAGGLAATAGTLGLSTGVEEAWGQGATTGKGALYGVANAGWEAAQWYAGGKIAGIGGTGPGSSIANGLFKSGAAARIGLDTATAASEGFARPAMNMIYKDYGDGSFIDKYKEAFKESGGWGNVGQCAAIGLFGSVIGEVSNARKLLKDNKKPDADVEGDTTPLLPGSGDGEIPKLSGEVIGDKKLLTTVDEGAEKVFASTSDKEIQPRLSEPKETPLLPESVPSPTKVQPGESLGDVIKRTGKGDGPTIISDDVLRENNVRVRGPRRQSGGVIEPGEQIVYNGSRNEYLRVGKDGYVTRLPEELFTSEGLTRGDIRLEYDDIHGVWRDRITGAETPISPKLSSDSTVAWEDTAARNHIVEGTRTGKAKGLHDVHTFIDRFNRGEVFLYKDNKYYIQSGKSINGFPNTIEISNIKANNLDGSLTVTLTDSTSFKIEPNSQGLVSFQWGNVSSARTLKPPPGSTFCPFDWSESDIKDSVEAFLNSSTKKPARMQISDTATDGVFIDSSEYRFEYINPKTGKPITMGVQVNGNVINSIYPIDVDLVSGVSRFNSYTW